VEAEVRRVEVVQHLGVGVRAQLALALRLPGGERADQLGALAKIPHHRFGRVLAGLFVSLGAVDQRERGGACIDELPDRLRLRQAVAIELDATRELLRRGADGEREEPEALSPGQALAVRGGGGGFWGGFGCTRRGGPLKWRPCHSNTSLVQAPTTTSSASSHMSRVSAGSMPKPSSSARVADRPVPNSRRPSHRQSSVAAISAT